MAPVFDEVLSVRSNTYFVTELDTLETGNVELQPIDKKAKLLVEETLEYLSALSNFDELNMVWLCYSSIA